MDAMGGKNFSAKNWWRNAFNLYSVLCLSSMALMGIGSGIFLLFGIIFFVSNWKKEGRLLWREVWLNPYSPAALALFLACLLSLVSAVIYPVEGSTAGPMFSSLKKFHYFLYPPLIAAAFLALDQNLERHSFWKGWGIMSALLGVVAMVQFFGASIFPESWLQNQFFRQIGSSQRYHGQGVMFFHLSFASCMCFAAALGWARLIFPLTSDRAVTRCLWGANALLASLGVFFSFSRVGLIALVVTLVFLGYLKRPKWGHLSVVVLLLFSALTWSLSPVLQQRFMDNRAGTWERERMWVAAIEMLRSRPLTGVGFSRTGELSPYFAEKAYGFRPPFTSHAHNNFLDMLAATGIIGTLCFILWWGFLFWAAGKAFWRSPSSERWLPAALLAGFLAFHVNGFTQVNFWDGKSEHTLMIMAGLAVALWVKLTRKQTADFDSRRS